LLLSAELEVVDCTKLTRPWLLARGVAKRLSCAAVALSSAISASSGCGYSGGGGGGMEDASLTQEDWVSAVEAVYWVDAVPAVLVVFTCQIQK